MRLKRYYSRETDQQQSEVVDTESESEDEEEGLQQPPLEEHIPPREQDQPEVDPHAHVQLQQEQQEVRGEREGPLMRDHGKFWCNTHPSNVVEGPRIRKQARN